MPTFRNYRDRIAFLKRISNYHFDPFLDEEAPFRIVGRFHGADWMQEVEALEEAGGGGEPFGFAHYAGPAKDEKRRNPQFDLELTGDTSYGTEQVFLHRLRPPLLCRESAPAIFKMVDWFAWEPGTATPHLHIQRPGQVFPIHVDGLRGANMKRKSLEERAREAKERPGQQARVQVQLGEWVWGHLWAVGNTHWKQWHAGEIMYHPWWKIPHGTANCSFARRYSLQVTGVATPLTIERLGEQGLMIDLSASSE